MQILSLFQNFCSVSKDCIIVKRLASLDKHAKMLNCVCHSPDLMTVLKMSLLIIHQAKNLFKMTQSKKSLDLTCHQRTLQVKTLNPLIQIWALVAYFHLPMVMVNLWAHLLRMKWPDLPQPSAQLRDLLEVQPKDLLGQQAGQIDHLNQIDPIDHPGQAGPIDPTDHLGQTKGQVQFNIPPNVRHAVII